MNHPAKWMQIVEDGFPSFFSGQFFVVQRLEMIKYLKQSLHMIDFTSSKMDAFNTQYVLIYN